MNNYLEKNTRLHYYKVNENENDPDIAQEQEEYSPSVSHLCTTEASASHGSNDIPFDLKPSLFTRVQHDELEEEFRKKLTFWQEFSHPGYNKEKPTIDEVSPEALKATIIRPVAGISRNIEQP